MIERLPNSCSCRVTQAGFRAALFFTRIYSRLLRLGRAAILPAHRALPTALIRAFSHLEAHTTAAITELALAP
jgi:hypothetical protein